MIAFILKLRKLEVRLIKKNFDAKRTLEDGASDAGSSEFSLMQSQEMLTQE